jgi:ribose-phosphate pyrophosphokinase
VLIVDDLCDGGGTFTAHASVLLAAGATAVDLYVTHGIFSKGLPLDHIDRVFTTDSYRRRGTYTRATVFPVKMGEL